MRKWHRWISTAAMVLLAWVAVTGILLGIDSMYPPAGLGGAPGAAPAAPPPAEVAATTATQPMDTAAIEQWLTTSIQAAVTDGIAPESLDVRLSLQDGQPQTSVTMSGDGARTVTVNAENGTVLNTAITPVAAPLPWYQDMETRVRLHDLLQELHRGTIIGLPGQILDILTGLSFVFLTISGAVMYFQLYLRRRKAGNKQWFWK